MTQDLKNPGGIQSFQTNMRADSTRFNQVGTMAEQSLWNGAIAGLFHGRDGFISIGCRPSKGAGDLDWLVDPGMAVITLPANLDPKEPTTIPIYVDVQQPGTFAAHDGANPRIDIISVGPLSIEDEVEATKVFSGGSSLNPDTHATRSRRSFELEVTQGTPAASPVAPATPVGHLLVGQFAIPAVSGPITSVADSRQLTGIASEANQHRTWKPFASALTAKAASIRTVTIRIFSLEGTSYVAPEGWPADNDQRYYMRARVYDADFVTDPALYRITSPSGAGNVTAINKAEMLIKTTAGVGIFDLPIEDVTGIYTGTLFLELTPMLHYSNTLAEHSKPGVPVTIEMDWA